MQNDSDIIFDRFFFGLFPDSLTDAHIWNLSKRITSESELMDLGINVLKQRELLIKAALYNKKEIQDATHEVLSTWAKEQDSRREAYTNLHAGLKKYQMNELAKELKQMMQREEESDSTPPRASPNEVIFHIPKQQCYIRISQPVYGYFKVY